jgi:cyclopropane-fatty-acyl-phospholipid synthase
MLYSCAYFMLAADTLDAAQTAKLHHLCRKLLLRPGDRLLDIGCGWGGLALFAAQEYGVRVVGVTLSAQQASLAANRVADAGLKREVTIELRDYRDVSTSEPFDAIVSVGMSEHVGRSHLTTYFEKVASLLKSGGVFLNHAIGEGARPRASAGPSFIQEYVFPDSDIPPIPTVLAAGEAAGLEVRDVENLREHYIFTLRHWVRRLEDNHPRALAFVDEPTFRVWRLYMAASAHGFDRGNLAVYQALFSKLDDHGRAGVPLTRDDWYVSAGSP